MIINSEITFLDVSFTNRGDEGFKNAVCNQSIIYNGIEKERKRENRKSANTDRVKAPHYYKTKLTTAPLRMETHTFLLNLRQSKSISLPSIHSLASMRPRGVICACVHL